MSRLKIVLSFVVINDFLFKNRKIVNSFLNSFVDVKERQLHFIGFLIVIFFLKIIIVDKWIV